MITLKNIQPISLFFCATLFVALTSCRGDYPAQLVQADSLLLRGDYDQVDSLLADYDQDASRRKSMRMYRQLVGLEYQFTQGTLNRKDFSMADSLVRYYKGLANREEALSHLFLGYIYKVESDYTSALDSYLKTEQIAEVLDDLMLKIWVNREQGNIYYEQGLYSDCIDYYKKYYANALLKRDTLRIAQSSIYMGRTYIINNNIDSIFFYYNQAIALANRLPESEKQDITIPAKSTLADIYKQIEEYDKAASLMTHNAIDDENWAYWHLAQSHTDSAYWYFSHLVEGASWKAKVDYLSILAELEEKRGNREHSRILYRDLAAAKDSLKAHSQTEETHKVKMLHELYQIKQERDEAQVQSKIIGVVTGIILVLVAIIVYILWRRNQKQRAIDTVQKKRILHEEKLQMLETLEYSPLRERIKLNAGKEDFHLTEEEWQKLATLIDNASNQFTNRLLRLCNMSEMELRVCYLIKIDVPPVGISALVCRNKNAISMLRKRLYEKITHQEGNAKQLDDFIKHF